MRCCLFASVLGLALAPLATMGGEPQQTTPHADTSALAKKVAELERQLAELRKEVQHLRRQLQPGAEANSDKAEHPVAWGKAVNGLQAGLRYSMSKSKGVLGEAVAFEVVVRNISKDAVQLSYVEPSAFLGAVEGDNQLVLRPVGTGKGFETTTTLAPRKETVFSTSLLLLLPRQTISPARPWVEIMVGKYQVSSPSVLLRRDGSDSKLATGFVDLEVLPPQEKKP
jgi:hypothetical protein